MLYPSNSSTKQQEKDIYPRGFVWKWGTPKPPWNIMEYHHVPLCSWWKLQGWGRSSSFGHPNLSSSPSVDLRDGQRGVLTAAGALSQSGSVGIDSWWFLMIPDDSWWFLMIPDYSWLGHIRSMLRRKMTISWNRLRISFEDQWIRKVLRHVEENHHSSWLPVNSNCWNMIHGFFFGTISVPSGKLTVCYWKWP